MKVVAIIPVYNEGRHVRSVIDQTKKHVDAAIVVDDGSTDDTVQHAEQAGAVVIRHPHNLGKGAACRSGFYAAMKLEADVIITLDGDGQHDPEEIPKFIEARKNNIQRKGIVLGSRMQNVKDMPWLRLTTNRTLSALISFLARTKINDSQSGFRSIDREVLEKVDYENNRYDAESEILVRAARAGFEIDEIPIRTIYGDEYSKINVFWDTWRFVRFFIRHLVHSPPVANSEAREISMSVGKAVDVTAAQKL